jgi:endonuclease/exonuclease/phosphatase family metal-dependent hydrolase
MRIVTWNIKSSPITDAIQVLAPLDADIISLQEVRNAPDLVSNAAQSIGMGSEMFVTLPVLNFGIATLFRASPEDLLMQTMPYSGAEPRGFIILEYPNFAVLNTHIEPGDRKIEQIETIAQVQSRYDKPFIVTGDFNERNAIRFFEEFGFTDLGEDKGITYPDLNARIDYIFARDIFQGIAQVIVPPISDHNIVVADIAITSGEEIPEREEKPEAPPEPSRIPLLGLVFIIGAITGLPILINMIGERD